MIITYIGKKLTEIDYAFEIDYSNFCVCRHFARRQQIPNRMVINKFDMFPLLIAMSKKKIFINKEK